MNKKIFLTVTALLISLNSLPAFADEGWRNHRRDEFQVNHHGYFARHSDSRRWKHFRCGYQHRHDRCSHQLIQPVIYVRGANHHFG